MKPAEISTRLQEIFTENLNNPGAFLEETSSLLKLAKELDLKEELIDAKITHGFIQSTLSHYDKAIPMLIEAFNDAKNIQDYSRILRSLNHLGYIYYRMGQFERAARILSETQKYLADDTPASQLIASYNNLGEIYYYAENYEESLAYYRKAYEIATKGEEDERFAITLLNLGNAKYELQEHNQAKNYYLEGLRVAKAVSSPRIIASTAHRLAKIFFQRKEIDKADHYMSISDEALQLVRDKLYQLEAKFSYALNDPRLTLEDRLKILSTCETLAKDIQNDKFLKDIYQAISVFYERENEYLDALNYFKKFYVTEQKYQSESMLQRLEILRYENQKHLTFGDENVIEEAFISQIEVERKRNRELEALNEELQLRVTMDELTNIPNRRRINQVLDEVLGKRNPLLFFMIDIDRFKLYNDTKGHYNGDICLKKIALELKRIAQGRNDFVGRYGGEEFVYIATEISYKEASILGEKLRKSIEQMKEFFTVEDRVFQVTISIGGLWCNYMDQEQQELSKEMVITLADSELYRAKNSGRNYCSILIKK